MPQSDLGNKRIALHILATSDVHGALMSGPDGRPPSGGLSRISTQVDRLRKQLPNCLLLDNGDFLQGTPLLDLIAEGALPILDAHPIISAMNLLDYDAAGLGNHEFDFGLTFLESTLKQANFPVVASNVDCSKPCWTKQLILERQLKAGDGTEHPVKIGILSVMPEQVVAWNASRLNGLLTTRDITETATQTAKSLRKEGAQIVIALVHSGIGGISPDARQENAAIPIAASADIDAMILGHTHQVFPDQDREGTDHVDFKRGKICGIPAIMPGFNGACLGHITLQLEFRSGQFDVVDSCSSLHPATPIDGSEDPREDPPLVDLALSATMAGADLLNAPIGHLHSPVHSYFSRLPGDPAVALVAQAQLEFASRNLKTFLPKDTPLISTASPFKGGGRGGPGNFACVPVGPVTRADLTSLHPFQNTLVALQINGAELREWLEMSASNFNRILPKTHGRPLRDTDFPCYGFDTVFGVTYTIDLTQPAKFNVLGKVVSDGHRIFDLKWQGVPVRSDQKFTLLTTSYRAGGGGNYPNAQTLRQIDIPATDSRKVLTEFVAQGVGSSDLPKSPWRFVHIPNAQAVALISPDVLPYFATGHRPEAEITAGPLDENGFVPFSVNLSA